MRQSPITSPALVLAALMAIATTTACNDTRQAEQQISDAAVTTAVKSRIAADPDLNPFEIDVDTMDGVVTLRGMVETEHQHQEAGDIARRTKGVLEVRNELGFGDKTLGTVIDDQVLLANVKLALTEAEGVDPLNVDVDVMAGAVTLSGRVESDQARRRAADAAASVDGVSSVDNRLEVEGSDVGETSDADVQ